MNGTLQDIHFRHAYGELSFLRRNILGWQFQRAVAASIYHLCATTVRHAQKLRSKLSILS
jgi:hypothetical protein